MLGVCGVCVGGCGVCVHVGVVWGCKCVCVSWTCYHASLSFLTCYQAYFCVGVWVCMFSRGVGVGVCVCGVFIRTQTNFQSTHLE